ncbi:uncharacterized protein SPPG_06849 [Spizellomyces punctatus DAOM BR117]|uniref:Velvet domain-containing protein n=1 Tax=Spizellomyces punctatus (strain DAOM BR117) TaxID=645134 RepID=A0A0L0HAV6_SPIPD|nr:uncharacterized protein SPPG_06849 [Spizellomyces punctatus DAOM BR117]KNC97853.1 hypothetical protein SPPG_06849 [Spizellomyces punctatus DAOM BR117]|eukprot:XP_016605893.1 hypothetical protein SPPG_06849 [Spizellomyces punctatus DAOM BR117]
MWPSPHGRGYSSSYADAACQQHPPLPPPVSTVAQSEHSYSSSPLNARPSSSSSSTSHPNEMSHYRQQYPTAPYMPLTAEQRIQRPPAEHTTFTPHRTSHSLSSHPSVPSSQYYGELAHYDSSDLNPRPITSPFYIEQPRQSQEPQQLHPRLPEGDRVDERVQGRRYELRIRQQPARARMSGFGNSDRRPVDPPPILQLYAYGPRGVENIDIDEACQLVVHASLWSSDGSEDRNIVVSPYYYVTRREGADNEERGDADDERIEFGSPSMSRRLSGSGGAPSESMLERRKSTGSVSREMPRETDQRRDMIQTLVGSVVSPCVALEDLEEREGLFFVFHDLSIRTPGQYRIRFSLLKLSSKATVDGADPGTPILATAMSDVVSVYQPKRFPGLLGTTELSECFARQGIPIHVRRNRTKKRGD